MSEVSNVTSLVTSLFSPSFFTQYFPPSPKFTDKDVPPDSQKGKVFLVTGANSGVGFELVKLLYPTGATIYLTSRSEDRARDAVRKIVPEGDTEGAARLRVLQLDLNDLTTVRSSAEAFAAQETRLDVLWLNAGVGGVAPGSTTKQNIEAHLGINCVGHLVFLEALMPLLRESAAKHHAPRVVWATSNFVEALSPKGGIDFSDLDCGATRPGLNDYAISKCGNFFLALEGARRYGGDGIISIAEHPGMLKTEFWDKHGQAALLSFAAFAMKLTLYEQKYGAYTMLYSGLSPDITMEQNGAYIMPWGRIMDLKKWPRKDILKTIEEQGPRRFWDWCEEKAKPYI